MKNQELTKQSIQEDRRTPRAVWRRKSQCTIFWTVLGLNIKEQIMKH